ncbi:hypothetical protein QJS10_CPB15g00379 [Acorus calamus]|uniref:Translation initiation factor 3 N-terminal domain-containing protein n=1 Tax=Acorus calamus TaxID=4465 RepID=A0AAV9D7E8_ACOCL|nr:hypothetical protein QJS10_CPB15g00379 [Acorus calamus]
MMGFWGRFGSARLCNRIYGAASSAAAASPARLIDGWGSRFRLVEQPQPFDRRGDSRFFAAPVQTKPKPDGKQTRGPRLNQAITSQYVRLVTEEGHAIVSKREALDRAAKLNMDLVEVQGTAQPPVCKIMDFHKEAYNNKVRQKEKERAKSKEQRDLQMKADMAKRLMDRGYLVKCMAMGSEEEDLGRLVTDLLSLIEDCAVVVTGPKVERRQSYVIVKHIKFGAKKNSGKNASKTVSPTMKSTNSNQVPPKSEVYEDSESISEIESDILLEEAEADAPISPPSKMPDVEFGDWSSSDISTEFSKVFDIDANEEANDSIFTGTIGNFTSTISPPEDLHGNQPAVSEHPGFPNSNFSFDILKTKHESEKEQTDRCTVALKRSSQPEPPHADANSYSRRSNPRDALPSFNPSLTKQPGTDQYSSTIPRLPPVNAIPSQGQSPSAPPPQSTSPKFQPSQGRNLRPSTIPSSPTNEQKPPSFDQSSMRSSRQPPLNANQGRPPAMTPPPTPSYGIFGNQRATSSDVNKERIPVKNATVSNSTGVPRPTFIPSSPPNAGRQGSMAQSPLGSSRKPQSDANQEPCPPVTPPKPTYGIFSTSNAALPNQYKERIPASSGSVRHSLPPKQRSEGVREVNNGSAPNKYGIFSSGTSK